MKHTLTKQEKEDLLAQQNPKYATELRNTIYLQLSLNHGVPLMDLTGLTWSQVDVAGRKLKLGVSGTEPDRIVKLSRPMVMLLVEWKEKQFYEWEKRRPGREPLAEQVFTDLDGSLLGKMYISNMLALYAESSGIRKKIDPENLHESFGKSDSYLTD